MPRIRFYKQDGSIHAETELTTYRSLYDAAGMMARCYLRDGSCHEGFVCFAPAGDWRKNYSPTFFLWTWAHLDENTHSLVGDSDSKFDQNYEPIDYQEVKHMDAILYSNPRWGGRLYNHFFVDTSQEAD